MAGQRSPVTEIREILRRLQLGERARRIARDLEVSRNTVAHYRQWAAKHGLLTHDRSSTKPIRSRLAPRAVGDPEWELQTR
jgi:FixJ family two-component response regulator